MKELLGDDGVSGTVGAELKKITAALNDTAGIQKIVDTASKNQANPAPLDVSTKFNELKAAVTAATTAIDDKLELGDLTQLGTSNLKALKSSINDIQSQLENTFADFGLDPSKTTNNIEPAKAKELLETLKTGVVESNTELGEKAVGVATSSQKQADRKRKTSKRYNNTESIFESTIIFVWVD